MLHPHALLSRLAAAALTCFAVVAHAAPHYAFTTSTAGSGDLHSWADVAETNLSGLAAADGICRARARAAGLSDADAYVAWLSDRNHDAYCRVSGFAGRKADRCGQPVLPTGAGPWLRTDGTPFADVIEYATARGRIYAPLNHDESGRAFFDDSGTFTATGAEGSFDTRFDTHPDCNLWTSNQPTLSASRASAFASTHGWTDNDSGVACNQNQHLLCMQQGTGDALVGHARFGHREAFLASTEVTGNLRGVAGADALCQASARSGGLYRPETFKALLSSYADNINIAERFQNDGAWYRVDGLLFAHDIAELGSGFVTLPLNVTETGNYAGPAMAYFGSFSALDCQGWTSTAGASSGPLVSYIARPASRGHWLDAAGPQCAGASSPDDWSTHVMCLADADTIFHDGLEARPAAF